MKGNQEMLEHGSFRSLLVRLSVPSVVIMLVMVVYNMADTYFIGQTGDPDRIAALSLCAPIFTVLSGLSTLLGSGGCIVISLALGSKNRDDIRKCTSFCFLGSLVIGFLFTGVMLAAMRPICYALGADSSTYAFTVRYLRVILPAAPITLGLPLACCRSHHAWSSACLLDAAYEYFYDHLEPPHDSLRIDGPRCARCRRQDQHAHNDDHHGPVHGPAARHFLYIRK